MNKLFTLLVFLMMGYQSQSATIDVGSGCTLPDAIRSANNDNSVGGCAAGSGTDTLITPDTYPVVLFDSLPVVTTDMTIRTQTENGLLDINAVNQHRIFEVSGQNTDLTLTRVKLRNGQRNNASQGGGGAIAIFNATVHLNDCEILTNTVQNASGGAIAMYDGELHVDGCVFDGNESNHNSVIGSSFGGAIFAQNSTTTIVNSLFQYNFNGTNGSSGASIYADRGYLLVEKSLIRDVATAIGGDAVIADVFNSTFVRTSGGTVNDIALFFESNSVLDINHLTLKHKLVVYDSIISMSNSIIGDCAMDNANIIVDSHNAYNTPYCNDNAVFDTGLGSPSDHGGPTLTIAFSPYSDLIDAGDPAYCLDEDQRGEPRATGDCDIGAYEANDLADIQVSREIQATEPFADGQEFTYTATIRNNGPGIANAVRVDVDTDNVTVVDINSSFCSSLPCIIDLLQDEQAIDIPITMRAGTYLNNTMELTLSAEGTPNSTHGDFQSNNNSRSNTLTIEPGADLAIDLSLDTPPPYFVGQTISYSATLSNDGLQKSTNTIFSFIPTNLTNANFTGCASVSLNNCTVLDINDGDQRNVTLTTQINDVQFNAIGAVGSDLLDINLDNNQDDQLNGGAISEVDISVTMEMDQNTPIFSDQYLSFKVKLVGGDEDASNVKIWSEFPNALFINVIGCSFLPCTIPLLQAEEVMELTLEYYAPIATNTIGPGVIDAINHRVFVQPGQVDRDLSDNEAIINHTLNQMSNLAVFADLVTVPPYEENQDIEFHLRALNGGIDTIQDVDILIDTNNLELQWMSGNLCTTETCNLSDMGYFQEENMILVYRISDAGAFDFSATISGPNNDPDINNNVAMIDNTAEAAPNDIIFADGFDE